MRVMRICYIDHYAGGPSLGMEYRPHAMAKQWQLAGHEVTLIAGTFSHLRHHNPHVDSEGTPQVIDDVTYRFIPTRSYQGNGLSRVLSMVDFVGRGIVAARRIADVLDPDVVIASSTYPFDTWMANRIARFSGARLIHEVHDLWPLTPMELGGYSPRHPLMWLMAQAEKSAYRNSDVIVSILPNIEPHVRSLGIQTPVVHVPNGVEVTGPTEPAPEHLVSLIDELHSEGRRVIGYAGGMATSNAMDDFVSAMGLLTDYPLTAILLGDGVLRPDLESQTKELEADIRFAGSVPKPQVFDTLRRMDALYIGSQPSPLYEFGVSANKIFDYMLTGVPIVNAFATRHSPMIYADCTIVAEAGNPESIAEGIQKATSLDPAEAYDLGQRGIDYVTEHHDLTRLSQDFLDAMS